MNYIMPLILLGVGLALILFFSPRALRYSLEQPDVNRESFHQVLERDLLPENPELLENKPELDHPSSDTVKDRIKVSEKQEAKPVDKIESYNLQEPGEAKLPDLELYNAVYRLYDAGESVTEIARQLGRGKGEIQLILNLRR